MPKRTIFRVAITAGVVGLIALLVAARPSAAQNATLSGRMTDQAGQPVSGGFVFFQRMPGFVFVVGGTTQADGSFQFSAPIGTYRLTADPRRGPFIPQVIETFAFPGTTTRNFTLARGVTLAGRVTDGTGAPVSQAFVNLQDQQFRSVGFNSADAGGRYSLGAPPGTYRINVSTQGRFIDRVIEGFALTQDQTLDIQVQAGTVVAGTVVDEENRPFPGVSVTLDDPLRGNGAEFFATTRGDGTFQFNVPPAAYVLTVDPSAPRAPSRVAVDTRSGPVSGLLIAVRLGTAPFVPGGPPRAGLISVSVPDAQGDVTVAGAPGAVAPNSHVIVITLETGEAAWRQAGSDGSFIVGPLFAPAGTSVLVKADPLGVAFGRFLANEVPMGGTGSISGLPGTILRVTDPPPGGGAVPVSGAGRARNASLTDGQLPFPAWSFSGAINTQSLVPGAVLRVQGVLTLQSAAAGGLQIGTRLALERLSGPDGSGALAHNTYTSIFVTPTGLPIERQPRGFNNGLDQFVRVPLNPAGNRGVAAIDLSMTIPADLPAGLYRPFLVFNFEGTLTGATPPRPVLTVLRTQRQSINDLRLPIVRVGNPAPPRVFWTLLTDNPSNGSRGVRAIEDRGHFGIAPRILTQSETFVLPRVDPVTGQPFTYRLEPFAPTVSLGDQDPPTAPLIPFRFPSGGLTVRIRRPTGEESTLGPAPFQQNRMQSLVDRDGRLLDGGGGHMTDVYQLSTLDPRFEIQFVQDGLHEITVAGTIDDVWGNTWTGGGTYHVYVARLLALDTAVLPGTPFETGDAFSAGVTVTPPVPANVSVQLRVATGTGQLTDSSVIGQANRFGHFHPAGGSIPLPEPGEYRVDVAASFRDAQGNLWMGSRTWGGVVASPTPDVIAHGRRGIDGLPAIGPQWFFRTGTGLPIGGNHVPFPFQSGDILWEEKSDSAIPLVTFQDLGGSLTGLMRGRMLDPSGRFSQFPLTMPGTFDERAAVGELPLFSSRPDQLDAHLDPSRVDLWAYSYRSVQRPLVRVREEIGEDNLPPPYWRFNEEYGGQVGVGQSSDLPHDIKFQYAGVVLRGPALPVPRYAIYGSLFVLVPTGDPEGGTRTFPPFQGNGGGPSGGPIITLKGREIDLFIHLTGVRPGTVLEVGDTFALSGAVGPPLAARVDYTVTRPNGQRIVRSGRANQVGYFYRPGDDFVVEEPGLYTVDLVVTYDGRTSAGQVTAPFPSGDVLGTASGRFHVYVVRRDSRPLAVDLLASTLLTAPAGFEVSVGAPGGVTLRSAHATSMMPGVVLDARDVGIAGGRFAYRHDPTTLAIDFPNLDVGTASRAEAADVVTLSLFASGVDSGGQPTYAARVLVLHGTTLFNTFFEPPIPSGVLDAFVTGFYEQVLGRSPEAAGLRGWADFLRANPTPAGASALVQGIFNSDEAMHRPMTLHAYVTLLYRTIMQREPSPPEVDLWVRDGVLPILNELVPHFVASGEFQNLLRTTPPSTIVSRLYLNVLGRAETPDENAMWTNWLAQGGSFEGLAIGFLDSREYVAGTRSFADHVTILYRTFLGREPEPAGLDGWLDFVALGLTRVQSAFTSSAEFQARIAGLFH